MFAIPSSRIHSGGLNATARLSQRQAHAMVTKEHPFNWASIVRCRFKAAEESFGEVRLAGMEKILRGLPQHGSPCALDRSSEWMDIGSAFGRFAMHVRLRTNISRVVGVELNTCRARHAAAGQRRIEYANPGSLAGLELIAGDVLSVGLRGATHIFLSVQCWPPQLIRAIVGELAPRSPRLRCMIFNARGVKSILARERIDTQVDAWGSVSAVVHDILTTWDPTEAVFVGKRSATGAAMDDSPSARGACEAAGGNRARRTRCASIRDVGHFKAARAVPTGPTWQTVSAVREELNI